MTLAEIVPWGRTYEEYQRMFALSDIDLAKTILGVGDGPASFNAEMTAKGGKIISIDPVYQFSADQIQHRVQQTYPVILEQTLKSADHYRWDYFTDVNALGRYRLEAMNRFLLDYEAGKLAGRYVATQLPTLPFANQTFELSLCSHLLFLYSKHLSLEFHYQSITELLRVSAEVRVFPLQTLAGDVSPYLEPVIKTLVGESIRVEKVYVAYEFQRGANQMLSIRRPD